MEFNHRHGHGHGNLLLPVSFNPYGDSSPVPPPTMMSLVTSDHHHHNGHVMATMVQPNYHIPLTTTTSTTTEQQQHHPYLQAVALFEEQRAINPLNHYGDSSVISSYDSKPQISGKFGGDFRNPLNSNNNNNNNNNNPPQPPQTNISMNVYNNANYRTRNNTSAVTTITTAIDSSRNDNGSSRKHGNINELEDNIDEEASLRGKIRSHPRYQQLVAAYVKCQKVGAPFEVVARLDELGKEQESLDSAPNRSSSPHGLDPELDQFMEGYCSLLQKLHEELATPFKEAMGFFRKMEQQLNGLSVNKGAFKLSYPDEKLELHASSEEEDGSYGEIEAHDVDPLAEDTKIKEHLLRKYRAYIGTLKKEFLKKKKKGKLPKEARQRLLDWWSRHYRWPYPSESEKASLAQSTGLDQKQINNWFINQRKRHWKPSEDNIRYATVGTSPNSNNNHDFPDGTSNIGGSLESTLLPMNR